MGAVSSIICLALLVLLIREMMRCKRETEHKMVVLTNISHAFRTPLTNLRLYSDILQSVPNMPAEERNRHLAVIADETDRLTHLVDNMLDYGRLVENRRTFAREEVDLPRLLRDVADRLRPNAEQAGIEISLAGHDEATVVADPDAVRLVAANLIDNAIKYGAIGRRVVLTVGADAAHTFFTVTDWGLGIPSDEVPHIFERFFRARATTDSGSDGVGLGLDIARGLMCGMDGRLDYSPNPEGGCIFRASFPARPS